ncbi:MAG TPA: 3-oxoacyl-ACP reductase FabG [Miltoncostaeaceae bacterium]|nr:3-oxoacyl-ACP reductase FabG [Miltoncostaeaceae bacterium]
MPVALVTGASRGIGAACAVALAGRGFDVGLTYATDRDGAEATAAAVRGAGRRAHVRRAEARDTADAAGVVAEVEEALGPLDALVANAGITRDGPAVRMDAEAWTAPIAINLTGTMATMRAALRGMLRRRGGSIVALSSVVGVQGNAGQVNYAASKAGIIGLVKALAREAGPRGVRVNAVAPGFIRTRLTDVLTDAHTQGLLGATALGRLGDPEDVAGPVAFLCSPESSFITGTCLAVDGGLRI